MCQHPPSNSLSNIWGLNAGSSTAGMRRNLQRQGTHSFGFFARCPRGRRCGGRARCHTDGRARPRALPPPPSSRRSCLAAAGWHGIPRGAGEAAKAAPAVGRPCSRQARAEAGASSHETRRERHHPTPKLRLVLFSSGSSQNR